MQPMSHQVMGYDRAITMFSPDGRLLQVEYAKKTVKQGSTGVGVVCKDGVVIITDKRIIDKLIVADSVEKIFKVDDHIASTASGILSDARVLIERAQLKAQQNRVSYDSPIEVLTIVKDMCDLKQICTQSAGLRPFGVSLLIAGVDSKGATLYKTDPTGIYFEYKACVIGEGDGDIEEIVGKEYKDGMSIDEAIKMVVKAMITVLNNNITKDRLDCVYIRNDDKMFVRMTDDQVDKVIKEVKKK